MGTAACDMAHCAYTFCSKDVSFLVWHGLNELSTSPFRYSFSGCSCDVQDFFEIPGLLDLSFKSTIGNWFFKKL